MKLEQLRLVLNVANSISAERAPSNILMASDAAARAEVRAKLARVRAETDRGVARAAGEGVPGPLIARVSRQLAVAQRLVDAAAAGTPPRYDDVQRTIDAMFSAYDAYQAIVEWQAQALIGSNPALRAPVMQALVPCALRDDAGRLGSQIIASLATHTAVPAQNIQDFYRIFQLEDINEQFSSTDVALVIGANDVVNPAARTDKSSAIYGMPILDADKAKQVFVIKRGEGRVMPASSTPCSTPTTAAWSTATPRAY